ncbi:MAG: flagellar hook-length control protein FliK [Clostridia bacterium]|nr:flagellar hook-length control protein FliK [Clostridia bacterium]
MAVQEISGAGNIKLAFPRKREKPSNNDFNYYLNAILQQPHQTNVENNNVTYKNNTENQNYSRDVKENEVRERLTSKKSKEVSQDNRGPDNEVSKIQEEKGKEINNNEVGNQDKNKADGTQKDALKKDALKKDAQKIDGIFTKALVVANGKKTTVDIRNLSDVQSKVQPGKLDQKEFLSHIGKVLGIQNLDVKELLAKGLLSEEEVKSLLAEALNSGKKAHSSKNIKEITEELKAMSSEKANKIGTIKDINLFEGQNKGLYSGQKDFLKDFDNGIKVIHTSTGQKKGSELSQVNRANISSLGSENGNSSALATSHVQFSSLLPQDNSQLGGTGISNIPSLITNVLETARLVRTGGQQEIQIKLQPETLGNLKLRATVEGNNLTLHLLVESTEAAKALQVAIPELRQAVYQQGLNLDQVQVQVGSEGSSENNQTGDFNKNRQGQNLHGQVADWMNYDENEPGSSTWYNLNYLA